MILLWNVSKFGRNWEKISKEFVDPGRSKKQCERHFDYLKSKFN